MPTARWMAGVFAWIVRLLGHCMSGAADCLLVCLLACWFPAGSAVGCLLACLPACLVACLLACLLTRLDIGLQACLLAGGLLAAGCALSAASLMSLRRHGKSKPTVMTESHKRQLADTYSRPDAVLASSSGRSTETMLLSVTARVHEHTYVFSQLCSVED